MLRLLNQRFQIRFERMAIAGYAETVPAETNETEGGRARNRRVDLVILNKIGMEVEPPAAGVAAAAPAAAQSAH